jgi:hypothetical protein
VYEAEREQYSDEFRAWCFKEIEKIIGRPLTDDDIMFKEDVLRRRAKRLINRIPSSWEESVEAFTNVAHKVHEAINKIENPTNRLKCAKAYAEAVFRLDKFVRDCDKEGFWARFNVVSGLVDTIPCEMPLALEFKWEVLVRQWLHAKDELAHYASFRHALPEIIFSGIVIDEKQRKKILREIDLENKKRRKFDRQHEMATIIRGLLRGQYSFTFERKLKNDCSGISSKRKEALMRMVIEAIGETPEWYKKELDGKLKAQNQDLQ